MPSADEKLGLEIEGISSGTAVATATEESGNSCGSQRDLRKVGKKARMKDEEWGKDTSLAIMGQYPPWTKFTPRSRGCNNMISCMRSRPAMPDLGVSLFYLRLSKLYRIRNPL